MSFLKNLYDDPLFPYYVPVFILLLGLRGSSIYRTKKRFKKHPENAPLRPKVQALLLWGARVHALYYVWYLAALFHMTPSVTSPSEDTLLLSIYSFGKTMEQADREHMLLTASTGSGTLNLKFLELPLGLPWLGLLISRKPEPVPTTWKTFVAFETMHSALLYSYLGRLWGQGDGGKQGKRVLQWTTIAHLTCGLVGDASALATRKSFGVGYVGDRWMDNSMTAIIAIHLVSAVFQMATVEKPEGLAEKVDPALDMAGLASPRDTKKSAPSPPARDEQHGGRQSADEPGPGR